MARSELTISLSQYRRFWTTLRDTVGPDVQRMAVVKADAYGLGAARLSRFLEDESLADWFGVATAQEASELRKAGLSLPILVMSDPLPSTIDIDNTHWVVGDLAHIAHLSAAASMATKPLAVHLKIDTGMNRLGCRPESAQQLVEVIHTDPHLRLSGVMSHFVESDIAYSAVTQRQVDLFDTTRRTLRLSPDILCHIANSDGVLSRPDARFNMVRVGIRSYEPIVSLNAQIIQLHVAYSGETISYGGTHRIQKTTTIATVSIGYADGIPRHFSGDVTINGTRCPVVGRVCMDMLMVDVGSTPVAVGDEVTFFGWDSDAISIHEFAEQSGRITYESLTALGRRVSRQLIHE